MYDKNEIDSNCFAFLFLFCYYHFIIFFFHFDSIVFVVISWWLWKYISLTHDQVIVFSFSSKKPPLFFGFDHHFFRGFLTSNKNLLSLTVSVCVFHIIISWFQDLICGFFIFHFFIFSPNWKQKRKKTTRIRNEWKINLQKK